MAKRRRMIRDWERDVEAPMRAWAHAMRLKGGPDWNLVECGRTETVTASPMVDLVTGLQPLPLVLSRGELLLSVDGTQHGGRAAWCHIVRLLGMGRCERLMQLPLPGYVSGNGMWLYLEDLATGRVRGLGWRLRRRLQRALALHGRPVMRRRTRWAVGLGLRVLRWVLRQDRTYWLNVTGEENDGREAAA